MMRKKMSKLINVIVILLSIGCVLCSCDKNKPSNENDVTKNTESTAPDINLLAHKQTGDVISVDGVKAYIIDKDTIAVPYSVINCFDDCEKAAAEKKLKGCVNPRLIERELEYLRKSVIEDILSLYADDGETVGVWSSFFNTDNNRRCYISGVQGSNSDRVLNNVAYRYTDGNEMHGLIVAFDITSDFDFDSVLSLNDDLLAEMGDTYKDLKNKYNASEYVYQTFYTGGIYMDLRNTRYSTDMIPPVLYGFGDYNFEEQNQGEKKVRAIPKEEAKCVSIITTAGMLFDDFGDGKTIDEIRRALDVNTHIIQANGDEIGRKLRFSYDGFGERRKFDAEISMNYSDKFISCDYQVVIR